MAIVKELCDIESTAGGPGGLLFKAGIYWSHNMVLGQITKIPLTVLGIIMRHVQHMAYTENNHYWTC